MNELVNVDKIGSALKTGVEELVNQNFRGETTEVGLYLAMARQAEREGYPEICQVLERIAYEEAWHAAHFAELNGMISESTKENLEKMLAGETGANRGKKEAATKAKDDGIDQAHDIFDEASRDEARHANALRGLLNRYFKG